MQNVFHIMGRVSGNLTVRESEKGKCVIIPLAVQRNFKGQYGKAEADFLDVACYDKPNNVATIVQENVKKGQILVVDGRITANRYKNKTTDKMSKSISLIAEKVYFGEKLMEDDESELMEDVTAMLEETELPEGVN